MDPITTAIVAALTAGAVAGVTETAKNANQRWLRWTKGAGEDAESKFNELKSKFEASRDNFFGSANKLTLEIKIVNPSLFAASRYKCRKSESARRM